MGIKGLRSFLRKRNVRGVAEHVPRGATLVVDGYSLMHHVLESHAVDRMLVSYVSMDCAVRQSINDLETQGFSSLVVFMDGSHQSAFKDMERGKRLVEQADAWYTTYQAVIEGNYAGPTTDLVLPPLASAQFVYSVRACGADVRFCVGEADQEIARCCSALNAAAGTAYCYSRDSDFVVMRDVAYIELDSLVFDGSTTVAEVWRRAHTAAQLELTEEQLVELSILIGNDYTSHLDRSALLGGAALPTEHDDDDVDEDDGNVEEEGDVDGDAVAPSGTTLRALASPHHAHRFILEHPQGAAFRLSAPDDPALQAALMYSRALYDLRDPPPATAAVLVVTNESKADSKEVVEEAQGARAYALSSQDVRAVDAWRDRMQRQQQQQHGAWASSGDVGRRVLDYLQTLPAADDGTTAVYKGITISHVRALARMLDALQTQQAQRQVHMLQGLAARLARYDAGNGAATAAAVAGVGASTAPGCRPALRWPDFVAANWYQLLCRCMLHGRKGDFHLQNASCMFDGELFVRLVAEEEGAPGVATPLAAVTHAHVPATLHAPTPTTTSPSPLLTLLQHAAAKTAAAAAAAPLPASSQPSASPPVASAVAPAPAPAADVLPIDAHREEILAHIGRDRVTIIHGETGCGKSSRLPLMLLEQAEAAGTQCRMMISQPRRIAASSLMKRLRSMPGVGDKVGLRMGHGVRDEKDGTVISFVTTGYLVRLVAHNPRAFRHHTHLIIDEVHERSIDGDLLCLLARRLLAAHRHLKLVLMSATMHTALYKQYFHEHNLPHEIGCLSVGVRRFPVAIKYLEDVLAEAQQSLAPLPSTLARTINGLIESTKSATGKQSDDVKQDLAKSQYEAAVYLVRSVAQAGKAVLIFVSGMQDIEKLYEQFEGKARYKLFAIHSEVAFEEQEQAFAPAGPDEVKVIIATNAAESSITLPDCDCVICLGSHKALRYDAEMHRVTLVNTWISKASATQRAGRTGRVRPGTVYRLYSKALFDKFQEHEESEVRRRTLQDVLLRLWTMLESSEAFAGVVPVLEALPEPPDMDNVDLSFHTLYHTGMITAAHNDGALTSLGRFAGSLPVDMQLGQLICYGIALGVGTEATVMAAALSQPQVAYRRASPFIHTDPDEFNSIVRTSFLTATQLDGGAYSEPIMGLNLFCTWMSMAHSSKAQHDWAMRAGLSHVRASQFASSALSLIRTTKDAMRYAGGPAAGRAKGTGGRNLKANGKAAAHKSQRKASRAKGGEDEDEDDVEDEDEEEDADNGDEAEEEAPAIDVDALLKRSGPWPLAVLNRLRLLLAWTCDGNVMHKPKPSNIPKQDFHTAHITCPSLTQAQAASLLPVSKLPALGLPRDVALDDTVSWHLHSGGRRIYDARLGTKRAASNLEELLKDLVAAASNGLRPGIAEVVSIYVSDSDGDRLISSPVAPAVWFVQQPQRGQADDSTMVILALPTRGTDSLARNVYYRIVLSIFAEKLVGVGAFDADLPTDHDAEEEEMEEDDDEGKAGNGNDAAVDGTAAVTKKGDDDGARRRFEMFHVSAASKRELLLLAKLHDTFPVSVSMLSPSIGNAKVMASNCLPTASQLKRIFFGDRVDEHLHDDTETQVIALEESKGLRRIAEQVIGGQQAIIFADTPGVGAATAGGGAGSGPVRRLLDDVPLGMRILDSYRAAQRDGKLRVWRDDDQVTPVAPPPGAPVGARGHPNRGGLPVGSGGAKGGPPVPDDVVAVTVRTVQSGWTTLPGLRMGQQQADADDDDEGRGGRRETVKTAILTKHSVPAVAMHRGPHTLYAVAFSCLVVGQGKKMAVCGGATVCPPGWHWLFLALTVLGVDAAPILHHEGRGHYLLPGGATGLRLEYSDAELKAMAAATELMAALPNRNHIARDDALIQALDSAFARWTSN